MVTVSPPTPSPTQESSKPDHPNDENVGAGLATRAATTFRGAKISSRTRVNGQSVLFALPDPIPNPHPILVIPPPTLPIVSRASRFSHPNPFSSLISDSESDDENIANPQSDDEETIVSLSPNTRDASNRPVTFPQPFTLLSYRLIRVNLCRSQHQYPPSLQSRLLICPPPLSRIQDALAS